MSIYFPYFGKFTFKEENVFDIPEKEVIRMKNRNLTEWQPFIMLE